QQDQVSAGLAGDLTMTLPRGQMDKLQAGLTFNPELTAPIQQGDVVGKVEVSLDGQVVQSTDLIALQTVEEGGLFSRLWDSIQLFFFNLFN
ncbi:MAG TPA: serine-type D-Ala-D-Ala carboxypeptidase, partial [Pseudomonas sp.]|nr:serine-type D-Ala-D-Ala carboxypeptidase [Pseudomonas sp.]